MRVICSSWHWSDAEHVAVENFDATRFRSGTDNYNVLSVHGRFRQTIFDWESIMDIERDPLRLKRDDD